MSNRQSVADTWTADTTLVAANASPISIASNEPWRLAVTIIADNANTGPVFVLPTSRRLGGVPVQPGAALILNTTAEVYAYSVAGGTVYVVSESASC